MRLVQLRNLFLEGAQQGAFFKTVLDDNKQTVVVPGLFDILIKSHGIDSPDRIFLVCIQMPS